MRSASWSPHTCTHSPQPLHKSETKMENSPPAARGLLLERAEDGGDVRVGQRELVDDPGELGLGFFGQFWQGADLLADDVLERDVCPVP